MPGKPSLAQTNGMFNATPITCLFLWITPLWMGVQHSVHENNRMDNTRCTTEEHWEFGNFGAYAGGTLKREKNKMILSTQNTRHCFFEADQYSFAYQQRSFPYDDCSKLSASVTIAPFARGSAGIMMRSNTRLGAANVHLETSATGDVLLFYRMADGASTAYTTIASVSLPVELKLVRQGTFFTGYYKNKEGQWVKGASVTVNTGTEFLTGFYGCSGGEAQIGRPGETNNNTEITFSNWNFQYEENFIPAEQHFIDSIPLKEGTLLRDNFNDGSLSNTPASISNPVWNGITYGNMPYDKEGGRYWHKTGDGIFYLGNKKWTDYQVSVDLSFDADTKAPNEFMLQLRYQHIAVYSKTIRYYAVSLRNGNKLMFDKYFPGGASFSTAVMLPNYFDGKKHNLKVALLDRNYEVYFDNKLVLSGADSLQPITYGNIALKFTNAAINLDNLEVISINDPINGAVDNYLQDYFDRPIPSYLKKYGF